MSTPDPNFKVFQSSNLQQGQYDPLAQTLTLTFTSGVAYVYDRIDPKTWEGLRDAVSPGSYFASTIRNNPDKFPVRKQETTT